jgi:hypothetical protein
VSDGAAAEETEAGAPDGNALAGAVAMTAGERSAGWSCLSAMGAASTNGAATGGGAAATGAFTAA